jgi:hypothetical protein
MTEECRHARIRTWAGQDDGKPAGLCMTPTTRRLRHWLTVQ